MGAKKCCKTYYRNGKLEYLTGLLKKNNNYIFFIKIDKLVQIQTEKWAVGEDFIGPCKHEH